MRSQKKSKIVHQQEIETSRKINVNKYNPIEPVDFKNAHFGRRRKVKVKPIDLYNIVLKHKVGKIINNFISKLRTNSVYRAPCEDQCYDSIKSRNNNKVSHCLKNCIQKFSKKDGIEIGNVGLIIWSLISIIQITIVVFMFSIMITFPETQNFQSFLYFRIFSIAIYFMDMVLSLTIKRYGSGKNLQKLGQISSHYIQNQFAIDLITTLIFPIDIFFNVQTNIEIFLFLLSIIKQMNNLRKFEKFEYLFINTSSKQHYYGLIKVLLVNFAIAHTLSIALNNMAQFDSSHNWYSKVQIQNEDWYVKYIWGYYWGTNIMLTVGFGDISATNTFEAFFLIFIEAFSCITLAYNISYVGALIGSLRENEKLKKRKLKIFHRMCKQNFISNQIEAKVANFIQVQHKIKEQFEHEAHDEVLKQLPNSIQRQFRQEANKSLFENLGFINTFFKKALVRLADKIERRVYHPQEIILQRGSAPIFSVLQTGSLALVCKIKSTIDGKQIQKIQVGKGQKPKIVSFDFIKNKAIKYSLKSLNFSVLFYLCDEQLMQCIRSSDISFQMYFMLKDKENSIYESQNHKCSLCKNQYHTKFQCSRLHYVPLQRHIIFKYIHRQNTAKQPRLSRWKRHKALKPSLQNWFKTKNDQKRYIEINFGDDHFREAEELCKFYSAQVMSGDLLPEEEFNGLKSSTNEVQIFKSTNKGYFKGWGRRTFSKLEKFLENKENKVQDFWDLQIDVANNYKFYFKEGNVEYISDLFSKIKRVKLNSTFVA